MGEKTSWFYWGIASAVMLGIFGTGIWVPAFRPMLWVVHWFVCIGLILVVLLQSGRAADLAGAFGGSGSQTAFGPRGAATFLSKATEFLAVAFMLSALVLGAISTQSAGAGGALPDTLPGIEQSAPADPGTGTDADGPTFGDDQNSEEGAETSPTEDDSSGSEE